MKKVFFILLLLIPFPLFSIDFEQMTKDLELLATLQTQQKRFPNNFNFHYSTGYFLTPSARMATEGLVGFGFARFTPYSSYNIFAQPFSFLELSANWQTCHDQLFSYRNLSDREANFKLGLFNPCDDENLPFIALGIKNFTTKRWENAYCILTKYFGPVTEVSLGWSYHSYHLATKGFFGAFSLYPFLSSYSLLSPLTFSLEVDDCSNSSFPFNFGMQYNYQNLLQFSLACLEGKQASGSIAISYNWGHTEGIVRKIKDPPLYSSNRYSEFQILPTFFTQGLRVLSLSIKGESAFISIRNERWMREHKLRERLAYLLNNFPNQNIKQFVVVVYAKNLACHSYLFCKNWLEKYCQQEISTFEFNCLTTKKEPCYFPAKPFAWSYLPFWALSPRFETFLGKTKGKFEYDLGLKLFLEGDLPYRLFYEAAFTITTLSQKNHLYDCSFNSHLPIVATDYLRYHSQGSFSTDILYLQCANYVKRGIFTRLALGYFQVNYGGFAGELLWYPSEWNFALGVDGAIVKKRNYHGFGFQNHLAMQDNCSLTFIPYTILSQYFLDLYFDFPLVSLFAKISVGQFLARDKGLYFELSRIFPSGLRLTGWTTLTNAQNIGHAQKYFDQGIKIEIPLELFYQKSSRKVFNYGMATWLRNAGYRIDTGKNLFEIINRERRF